MDKDALKNRVTTELLDLGRQVYLRQLALKQSKMAGDWLEDQEAKFSKMGAHFSGIGMSYNVGHPRNLSLDEAQRLRGAFNAFLKSEWSTPEGSKRIADKAFQTITKGKFNKEGLKVSEGSYKELKRSAYDIARKLFGNRRLSQMSEYFHVDSDQIIKAAEYLDKYIDGDEDVSDKVSHIMDLIAVTSMYRRGKLQSGDIMYAVTHFATKGFDADTELTEVEQVNELLKAHKAVRVYRKSSFAEGKKHRDFHKSVANRYNVYKEKRIKNRGR